MFFIFFSFFFFRLKSRISITAKPTIMKICMYRNVFLACALSGYIFVNPFTSCVTDRYQHKQYIIMGTETEETRKFACIEILLVVCMCNMFLYFC